MKYLALAALACVPIAAAAGYVAHQDPAAPPFGQYVADQLAVKHVAGGDTDDWLAVAVSGPNKGGSMNVIDALSYFRTHKDLEQSAQGKVAYYEVKCANYTTGGKTATYTSARVVRSCNSVKRTRKQAEEYMTSLLAPEPKS